MKQSLAAHSYQQRPVLSTRSLPGKRTLCFGTLQPTAVQPTAECTHPDAVARRVAREKEALQREQARAALQSLEAKGLKWWEGPCSENVSQPKSLAEYKSAVERGAKEKRLLVAKFFTSECYVCKSMHPKIMQMAAAHPDVLFLKLNGSDPQLVDLFKALGITKVPYFHLVLDKQLVSELSASLSPERLAALRLEIKAHRPQPPPTPQSAS